MTAAFAALIRALFPLVAGVAALGALWLGWAVWGRTGDALPAVAAGGGALLAVVALFGVLALAIENNRFLQRIADATERGRRAAGPPVTQPLPAPPEAQMLAEAPRGPAGRREPVLVARR